MEAYKQEFIEFMVAILAERAGAAAVIGYHVSRT